MLKYPTSQIFEKFKLLLILWVKTLKIWAKPIPGKFKLVFTSWIKSTQARGKLILEKLKLGQPILLKYWFLIFCITTIAYMELVYRLWNFKNVSFDYVFPVIFAFPAGILLFLMSSTMPVKVNKIGAIVLISLMTVAFGMQLVYFSIFHMPLSIYSLAGAADAMQFGEIILSATFENIFGIILLFIPLILLILIERKTQCKEKFQYNRIKPPALYFLLVFCMASYLISIICVNLTDEKNLSQRTLYYNTVAPELSAAKLGLMTTMRLDFQRLVFGFEEKVYAEETDHEDKSYRGGAVPAFNSGDTGDVPESSGGETVPVEYNIMDIDFEALIANEKDAEILDMHEYFYSVEPTKKNKYTGIFKGDNLILITAEAFSPYFISPELTPTLYKMSIQGFVFNNFYNPIWSVSTSDGEYVACTGLIPKSGVWSFSKSGKNFMPFTMGNQFRKLDYITKAYHNHSYTYYDRDTSHPNMGYDYKGLGNGLKVRQTWPESDREMIEITAGDYIGRQPFHTYYMTVSGHMNYNFNDNFMAGKNKSFVEHLPVSEASKAYIACNMEFEFAMRDLLDKLEAAGIAGKTVIAISADHYPYGLPRESIDELAGHKVEENFELYKSTFILWKEGMETVFVDKPCSSLDIIPTLSNMFGLEYDSRLLMGRDIFSDDPPLVIFSNRSWITDKAMYNTVTNTPTYMDEAKEDKSYVKEINKIVGDKFKYSAKILDRDYYGKVIIK